MGSVQQFDAGRRVVLVDIENIVGGSDCPIEDVRAAFDQLDLVVETEDTDLVFVAAAPRLAMSCGFVRPQAKVWCAHGTDGAELRLMNEVSVAFVADRADVLVIASGDHRFVDYAAAAREAGVSVRVVGRRWSIHHQFWTCGFAPIELDTLPLSCGEAGALAA